MKKNILLILLLVASIYIHMIIPKYNELNNIIIIDKIKIYYDNNDKKIILREIKPQRENNKISYKYKYYNIKTNNIKNLNKELKNKYNKTFYYKHAKIVIKYNKKELE